jgi:hypothetical protein
LKRTDALRRVVVALRREVESLTRDSAISADPSARYFPGSVPSDAPREARAITLDSSVPGWHSTGLYAIPGEPVHLAWGANAGAFRVHIGCHTDTLWHHDSWKRAPDISRSWDSIHIPNPTDQAHAGVVVNPYGGLVYIEMLQPASGEVRCTISNAAEAPRFVLGKTTREEWLASRDAPAPWGELESDRVIVSVPSSALRGLDDPTALMEFWNAISDAHAALAMIPMPPPRPHRFVADVQISAGYMHAGYPIMTHLDAVDDMTSLERLRRGPWGLLHELGHNHQEGEWTFEGTGEVTCNLFALHAIDTICAPRAGSRGHDAVNSPPDWRSHVAGGADFKVWKRSPFLALHMYVQLEESFGWETFKEVIAEYRALARDQRPRTDIEKRDQWMVRFSRACERNLGPFFQAWGVPTSEEARASITDLPEWMPADWPE